MRKVLITGGCGFIGSNFIRYLFKNYDYQIINLDALTYAGNPNNLKDIAQDKKYKFIKGRVEDGGLIKKIMKNIDYIIHFAAESHVDRSISDASPFVKTNIIGTQVLLDSVLNSRVKKFLYISTDEVYGSIIKGKFQENSPFNPTSPYAASKAAADLLVRSYFKTYNLPIVVVRPSNNYGPYQYPEKFIPLMITQALQNKSLPLYGKGKNVRDWLYVEDNCQAIDVVLQKGKVGEVYNIGGKSEKKNIEIAKMILKIMKKSKDLIKFVSDRPSHDFRYAISNHKIKKELGWKPEVSLECGIEKTINWYKENRWWWDEVIRRLKKERKGYWTK